MHYPNTVLEKVRTVLLIRKLYVWTNALSTGSCTECQEDVTMDKNWLLSFIKTKKKLFFIGNIKSHNGFERTIIGGMVAGKWERGKPRR